MTFENTVSKILPRRACMKRLMRETVEHGTPFSLTTPLGMQREVKLVSIWNEFQK